MNPDIAEEWRRVTIPGYAEFYEVSSFGRVRSLDRTVRSKGSGIQNLSGQLMKIRVNPRGYAYVYLRASPMEKNATVHRLVASAFIPNPLNLPEVNHIDTIKTNNTVSNLEWINRVGNHAHATKSGLQKVAIRKLSDDDVARIIRLSGGISHKDLADEYDVNPSTISRIVNGLRRTSRL